MEFSLSPVASFLFGHLKRLISLWRDEAVLNIEGEIADVEQTDSLPVFFTDENLATLRFAVRSTSKSPIELLGLRIEYAAPLQLIDPDHGAFFKTELTSRNDLPFCLKWDGSLELGNKLIQYFVIGVLFPESPKEYTLNFRVYTRRTHKLFGFLEKGRTQETSLLRKLAIVAEKPLGISLDPGWSASSPQPFVIKGEHFATVKAGNEASIVVHEISDNGRASSKTVKVSKA